MAVKQLVRVGSACDRVTVRSGRRIALKETNKQTGIKSEPLKGCNIINMPIVNAISNSIGNDAD